MASYTAAMANTHILNTCSFNTAGLNDIHRFTISGAQRLWSTLTREAAHRPVHTHSNLQNHRQKLKHRKYCTDTNQSQFWFQHNAFTCRQCATPGSVSCLFVIADLTVQLSIQGNQINWKKTKIKKVNTSLPALLWLLILPLM